MAEIFRFFNSAPGDERWHYASDFADYFGSVLSSGLISNKNEPVGLQVTVNSGTLTTNVAIGKALMKGYSYENTQPITLTHGIPEQTMDRVDRIVLRLDLRNSARFIKVFVKEGVSATTPIPPVLQRDTTVYELSLAKVTIRKNSASIVVSDIVDERANEELCGIVQSLITVPTSVFQQQFTAWFNSVSESTEQEVSDWQAIQQQAFNDWFVTIQGQLDGDVGANLANQIATHQNDGTAHGIGDKTTLKTSEKTTIVGAVNELFTSASNGKIAIANAITGKGQTASGSDTFTQLASAISSINTGKKWASGTATSSTNTSTFQTVRSSSSVSAYSISVSNLTFKASTIIITGTYNSYAYLIVYSSSGDALYSGSSVKCQLYLNDTSANVYTLKADALSANVTPSSFTLPLGVDSSVKNVNFTWIAYE